MNNTKHTTKQSKGCIKKRSYFNVIITICITVKTLYSMAKKMP